MVGMVVVMVVCGGAGDGSNGGRIPQGQLGEARGAIKKLVGF